MRFYGLTQADIEDRLIVIAKGEIKIKMARQVGSGNVRRIARSEHDGRGRSRSEPVQFSRDQQSQASDAENAAVEGS
jgi:hypothetical protein